jgi:hypothetical protein
MPGLLAAYAAAGMGQASTATAGTVSVAP